nr:hypothetical protein [Tanacetum cinerariifolium]
SAFALITPGWAAAFASPPIGMSFSMIVAGATKSEATPPTPIINILIKHDSSTLLEIKSNKLHIFLSLQESLQSLKKSSAANLKDKATTRAAASAFARYLDQNNKISSGRGLSDVAMATSLQRWNVYNRLIQTVCGKDFSALSYEFVALLDGISEDPLKLERDKHNTLEALSAALVNENDDQDGDVNVDFNKVQRWDGWIEIGMVFMVISDEFPLPEQLSTAYEDKFPLLIQSDATAKKIAQLFKTGLSHGQRHSYNIQRRVIVTQLFKESVP